MIGKATSDDAAICFWVRSSHLADGLERRVLHHLIGWLRDDLPLRRALFTMHEGATRQVSCSAKRDCRKSYAYPGSQGIRRFCSSRQKNGDEEPGRKQWLVIRG